jgi:hypothetical protein
MGDFVNMAGQTFGRLKRQRKSLAKFQGFDGKCGACLSHVKAFRYSQGASLSLGYKSKYN